jgi:hypothetical protein
VFHQELEADDLRHELVEELGRQVAGPIAMRPLETAAQVFEQYAHRIRVQNRHGTTRLNRHVVPRRNLPIGFLVPERANVGVRTGKNGGEASALETRRNRIPSRDVTPEPIRTFTGAPDKERQMRDAPTSRIEQ